MVYTPYPWKLYWPKLLFFSFGKVPCWKAKGRAHAWTKTNHTHKILASSHGKLYNSLTTVIFIMHLWPAFCLPTNSAFGITFHFPALEVTLNCCHLVLTSDSEMILPSPLCFGVSIRIAPVCDPERKSCPSQHLFLVKVMFYSSLLLIWLFF